MLNFFALCHLPSLKLTVNWLLLSRKQLGKWKTNFCDKLSSFFLEDYTAFHASGIDGFIDIIYGPGKREKIGYTWWIKEGVCSISV